MMTKRLKTILLIMLFLMLQGCAVLNVFNTTTTINLGENRTVKVTGGYSEYITFNDTSLGISGVVDRRGRPSAATQILEAATASLMNMKAIEIDN